jgi:Fic family protein
MATTILNERQIKVLNRLLDTAVEEFAQGINARKYQSLAEVSKATATRDLAELVEKGVLRRFMWIWPDRTGGPPGCQSGRSWR